MFKITDIEMATNCLQIIAIRSKRQPASKFNPHSYNLIDISLSLLISPYPNIHFKQQYLFFTMKLIIASNQWRIPIWYSAQLSITKTNDVILRGVSTRQVFFKNWSKNKSLLVYQNINKRRLYRHPYKKNDWYWKCTEWKVKKTR